MKKIIGFYRKCDLVTMTGTTFAFIGMLLAIKNHHAYAIVCLIISGICDAFDGTIARKLKSTTIEKTYGVELDSLSDVICFGVFPAIITVTICNNIFSYIVGALYMLCGLVRLTYFNTLNINKINKEGKFIGFPITTVAILYPLMYIILRMINYNLIAKVMPFILIILGISYIINKEIPKISFPNLVKKIFNKYTMNFLVFPLYLFLGGEYFYKLNNYNILSGMVNLIKQSYFYIKPTFIIILIIILLNLLLNVIFKKSNRSKLFLLILFTILLVINDIKYKIMGIPVQISDISTYLNLDGISMMETAGATSIGTWIIITIIKSVLFLACGLLFVYNDKKKNKNIVFNKLKYRLLIFLGLVGLFIPTYIFNSEIKDISIHKIYNISYQWDTKINSIEEMCDNYGFLAGVYLDSIINNSETVEGYDKETIDKVIASVKENDKTWGKANIVFILSEAFSDLENIDEITFNKSLTPNIDRYETMENAMVMNLNVNAFGGTSVNTEFEILTGASLALWKNNIVPYTQYYTDDTTKNAPNIIKELNNNDYETIYFTAWGSSSYKSQYVYNSIGVDKTVYNYDKGEKKGNVISDKAMMDGIYNELKDSSENNYKFIMAATAQNHFPYNTKNYQEYDIEVTNSEYNKENTNILKNYAQGIYDADEALDYLYQKINDLDTPTIIVFFGDHLPYTVDSKGNNPYTSSKYFNTDDEYLNYLRTRTTKAVILANYDIATEDISYINASYLGSYVINKMDLNISNYFKAIESYRKIIPVFNRNITYINNEIININKLNDEQLNTYKNYQYTQYRYFYDYTN